MRRFQYSSKTLAIAFAAVAALCAVPAHYIARIRAETRAGDLLDAVLDQEDPSKHDVDRLPPEGWLARAAYSLAGSPGQVFATDICGERSARVLVDRLGDLPNLKRICILGRRADRDRRIITQEQIDAVSRVPQLEELLIYGFFARQVRVSALCRIGQIDRLHIQCDELPARVIEHLGFVRGTELEILCLNTDVQLPAESFASFVRSSYARVWIWANIDDRAFELIARAPRLQSLEIEQWGASSPITDDGLRLAAQHLQAYHLAIRPSDISDAAIEILAQMRHLRYLNLDGSRITPEGARRLAKLRPDLDLTCWNPHER